MDDEEKSMDDVGDLGQDLRQALFETLTSDDLALIAEARAAMEREGRKKPRRKKP